jgi:hypothetical protein
MSTTLWQPETRLTWMGAPGLGRDRSGTRTPRDAGRIRQTSERQRNNELRPGAWLASHLDPTAVLKHDPMAQREAQTGPVCSRGEKWLKQPLHMLGRDSVPAVRHGDQRFVPRSLDAEANPARLTDGAERVVDQVDPDLAEGARHSHHRAFE